MNVLGVFVKHPVPGGVKTRLAAALGEKRAAQLYEAFVIDVANQLRCTADERFLCYAPADASAREYFRRLAAAEFRIWPQPESPLGVRMENFFHHAFELGARNVVLIGSDSPTLPASLIDRAFRELEQNDVVVGPATDGGYYLVGQRLCSRPLFDEVDWSSPHVLEQTMQHVQRLNLRLALLSPWYDVDTVDDLLLVRGHLSALELAGATEFPRNTLALLQGDFAFPNGSV